MALRPSQRKPACLTARLHAINRDRRRRQPHAKQHRAAQGFGLLEVIVALVILSTSGLALFAWINQSLATATRLRDTEARAQLQIEAQAWLSTINPALEPEGDKTLGTLRLRWRAALVEPMQPENSFAGNIVPRWLLGLYRLDATAQRTDSGLQTDWQQLAAGWKPLYSATPSSPEAAF